MAPRNNVLKRTSQTNGFSGFAQRSVEMTTEPTRRIPPIVGVPFFAPCNSKSLCTSSLLRIGWPNFRETSFRITQLPKIRLMRKAVIPAQIARNVM